MKRFLFCIALASGLLAYRPVLAAVDLYLKLDGIEGESTDEAHKDWIDLSSFQFGVTQPGTGPVGGPPGRVNFSDFSIMKHVDKSSPSLLFDSASGTRIKDAVIDVVKAGTDQSKPFLQYTLSNVLVSSYSTSGDGDRPTESVSFEYTKIEFKYSAQNPDGTLDEPISVKWDLVKNEGSLSGVGAVPEPSSWAMVVVGVLVIALRARKMMRPSTR
jgi:type VI secretion system secreted protein Hcp